jgi:hypothetical protein
MRTANGEFPGQAARAALPAVRMNELDKLGFDKEPREGPSSGAIATEVMHHRLQSRWMR